MPTQATGAPGDVAAVGVVGAGRLVLDVGAVRAAASAAPCRCCRRCRPGRGPSPCTSGSSGTWCRRPERRTDSCSRPPGRPTASPCSSRRCPPPCSPREPRCTCTPSRPPRPCRSDACRRCTGAFAGHAAVRVGDAGRDVVRARAVRAGGAARAGRGGRVARQLAAPAAPVHVSFAVHVVEFEALTKRH